MSARHPLLFVSHGAPDVLLRPAATVALWADLGGTPRPDKDFDFPVVPPVRPISDFPSGKRADAQRRQTLREALAASIRDHLTSAPEVVAEPAPSRQIA